jgi:hypothetical protein
VSDAPERHPVADAGEWSGEVHSQVMVQAKHATLVAVLRRALGRDQGGPYEKHP